MLIQKTAYGGRSVKEIQDIIKAFELAQAQNIPCALATVVHVDGSSYRRAGAKMLITSDGQLTGAISGGCLEGDALRKAQLVMMEHKTMLVTYDTSDEDDAKLGMGLGCNGIIHVLIEPIDPSNPFHPISFLKKLVEKRQQAVLVTLFSLRDKKQDQPGTRFIYTEDEKVFGYTEPLSDEIAKDASSALETQESFFKNYPKNQLTAFIQLVTPPVSLIILGAGNDVKPIVQFADILGWETTLMDGRPNFPTRERFPLATNLMVRKATSILEDIQIDQQTIFLLMTHNYNYDLTALKILLKEKPAYIGMLGPKKKLERMLEEMPEQDLNTAQMSLVHTPAGLDIGAETPEEIALSIIAEIKTVLAGKKANFLKGLTGTIHSRNSSIIH